MDAPARQRVPVVVNRTAGPGRRDRSRDVEAALTAAGVSAMVQAVAPSAVGTAIAREAAAGADLIGVAGGDGTLLSAAEALAGSGIDLAVLPGGTLNHFARRLGVPTLEDAASALAARHVITIPMGVVDDKAFLNTATFGFYADVVRRREHYRPMLGKWGAAAVAVVLTLARAHSMDVALVLEGRRVERRTSLVWVGVGRGSFPLVHQSRDDSDRPDLEIVVLRPRGLVGTAALILRTLLSLRRREHPIRDRALEVLHARRLLIAGRHRIGVTLDGEVLRCAPPVFIAVQDDALRVVVPAGVNAEEAAPRPEGD